ncbi:MAG: hypothetical protein HKN45_04815 [Flavobacteriales bacterium]|nr:hypothetical protein [Flavobacteriales bacterium]NNK81142.1 hypothetical protein [Flavobacteriales bacterium]
MINWGQGIAAFLTIFVIFIGVLVYMTTQSTWDLEKEDYYKQEIEYQDRIDALVKGKEIDPYLRMDIEEENLVISLEGMQMTDSQDGKVEFFRANDSGLDRQFDLDLSSGSQSLPLTEFVKGMYKVSFTWTTAQGVSEIERELKIN